jgi:hypothetical protein
MNKEETEWFLKLWIAQHEVIVAFGNSPMKIVSK